MKKFLILLFAFSALLPAAAGGKAKITFATKTHDFGYVKEKGGNVTCQFEFKNTGSEPLIIVNASASCGCTRPAFPKQPIMPDSTGIITVTYVPAGRPGTFDKSVTVRTNASTEHLRIKGSVIP